MQLSAIYIVLVLFLQAIRPTVGETLSSSMKRKQSQLNKLVACGGGVCTERLRDDERMKIVPSIRQCMDVSDAQRAKTFNAVASNYFILAAAEFADTEVF